MGKSLFEDPKGWYEENKTEVWFAVGVVVTVGVGIGLGVSAYKNGSLPFTGISRTPSLPTIDLKPVNNVNSVPKIDVSSSITTDTIKKMVVPTVDVLRNSDSTGIGRSIGWLGQKYFGCRAMEMNKTLVEMGILKGVPNNYSFTDFGKQFQKGSGFDPMIVNYLIENNPDMLHRYIFWSSINGIDISV